MNWQVVLFIIITIVPIILRLYKTSGGGTTGLWKHMSSAHKDVDCERDII